MSDKESWNSDPILRSNPQIPMRRIGPRPHIEDRSPPLPTIADALLTRVTDTTMILVAMDDQSAIRSRLGYLMLMFLLFMMFSPNPPNPYRIIALEALAAREKH